MGPGFESQRDHKAPTQVGAFFMQRRETSLLDLANEHEKSNQHTKCDG